ncbi:MAG TPA: EamA family transporter [Blastocatellia bacterium]
MRQIIFLFFIVFSGTGGELCLARAMKIAGEVTDFRPAAILKFVLRAMTVGWMWIGISMMALAFFSLLAMLSIANVSFVVPVTALSYAAGALGGAIFLGEKVSANRWLGVLLVCAGVTLVWWGKG